MILRRISLLALLALTAFNCASRRDLVKPSQLEIDQYIKNNPDLPEYDKQLIYDGRFEIGIRVETLRFLLGEPKEIITVKQPWATQQKWIYKRRGQKIFIIEDEHVVGILEED